MRSRHHIRTFRLSVRSLCTINYCQCCYFRLAKLSQTVTKRNETKSSNLCTEKASVWMNIDFFIVLFIQIYINQAPCHRWEMRIDSVRESFIDELFSVVVHVCVCVCACDGRLADIWNKYRSLNWRNTMSFHWIQINTSHAPIEHGQFFSFYMYIFVMLWVSYYHHHHQYG